MDRGMNRSIYNKASTVKYQWQNLGNGYMGLDCQVLSVLLYVKIFIIRCSEKLKERKRNEKRERKKNETKQNKPNMVLDDCCSVSKR